MSWKVPEYRRRQIIQAGDIIIDPASSVDEKKESLRIIDNWRASHAYPLQIIYLYLKRISRRRNFIVAQRLKRLESIVKKLEREPTMNLWTMQDLGGCRIVVPSVKDVYEVADKLKTSSVRHILKRDYDYIEQPKTSGYRSYHMVYQYQSDSKDTYNQNMLIEIQIRTQLQHIWATAVETMGLFTNQALKASLGEEDTLRFFALVSSLFAVEENMPLVPETPKNREDIISELELLEKQHKHLSTLSAMGVAVERIDDIKSTRTGYYMLILDHTNRRLRVRFYKSSEVDKATEEYNKIESERDERNIDAVLVSVSSFSKLKAAYPNYFSELKDFISAVRGVTNLRLL